MPTKVPPPPIASLGSPPPTACATVRWRDVGWRGRYGRCANFMRRRATLDACCPDRLAGKSIAGLCRCNTPKVAPAAAPTASDVAEAGGAGAGGAAEAEQRADDWAAAAAQVSARACLCWFHAGASTHGAAAGAGLRAHMPGPMVPPAPAVGQT